GGGAFGETTSARPRRWDTAPARQQADAAAPGLGARPLPCRYPTTRPQGLDDVIANDSPRQAVGRLNLKQILTWADAHYRRTKAWPTMRSGAVDGVKEETWKAIDSALRDGLRGMRRGSSLARLLADKR